MANGLKGKFISYTNSTGSTVTVAFSGVVSFQLAVNAIYSIWTAQMEDEGAINGQGSFKQAMAANFIVADDCNTRQANSDFFETFYIEVPNAQVLTGWIWGQNATWVAS